MLEQNNLAIELVTHQYRCVIVRMVRYGRIMKSILLAVAATLTVASPSHDGSGDRDQQQWKEMISGPGSVIPHEGVPRKWADCVEGIRAQNNQPGDRVICDSWASDGVTTTLVGLLGDREPVPILESRLEAVADNDLTVVYLIGGPGGKPFNAQVPVTEAVRAKFNEIVASKRLDTTKVGLPRRMNEYSEHILMKRGYTVAAVLYWGTSVRTLDFPDEFALAAAEVRQVVDYYRGTNGREPALITQSLGNHLSVAGLGKERLQQMNVLSLVPVMDGLQHHLTVALPKLEKIFEEAEREGRFSEMYNRLHIYELTDNGTRFGEARFLDAREYVPRYLGSANFAYLDVIPQGKCSTVVLGSKDPRTLDYLSRTDVLPPYVQVWDADHAIESDAPVQYRQLYSDFADCLVAQKG